MHRWWFDVGTRHPCSTVRRGRIECVIGQVYSILYAINMIIDIPLEIYKLNANVRFLAKPHAPHLPHADTQRRARTACTTDELCSALKRKLNVLSSTLAIINKSIMCKCIQIYIYLFRTKRAPLVAMETAQHSALQQSLAHTKSIYILFYTSSRTQLENFRHHQVKYYPINLNYLCVVGLARRNPWIPTSTLTQIWKSVTDDHFVSS